MTTSTSPAQSCWRQLLQLLAQQLLLMPWLL
jgi:hypothetical protein